MGPVPLRIGIFCLWIAVATLAPRAASAVTVEGDISYTSDYIFRGVSESGSRSAGQIDVQAEIIGIGPDPNPANNHQRAVVIVCAEKATDPKCN